MPELLTRRETPQSVVGRLAGFKSEWWPDLFRNGGRHQFGTMAGFPSEYLAGFNRNPHVLRRYFFSSAIHMRNCQISPDALTRKIKALPPNIS